MREQLRDYIRTELMRNPAYDLRDDEPLITGGLIDSFCLAHLSVFIEGAFAVYLPDTDLTAEEMDTIDKIVARVVGG